MLEEDHYDDTAETSFPWLSEEYRIKFPEPQDLGDQEYSGLIGIGANLSPGVVLSAYEQGAFPWYAPGEPLCWWSPPDRTVIFPERLHISRSMKRFLRNTRWYATYDTNFAAVIQCCRYMPRKVTQEPQESEGEQLSWITDEMEQAYILLHQLGYAHSIEIRDPDKGGMICGGLYGVSIGGVFCGESMFSLVPQSSKMALISLIRENPFNDDGLLAVDCQFMTPHLRTLGAEEIPRQQYLALLARRQ